MTTLLAHGIGGRSDLPLPLWLFAYGAGFALLISFVALRILWPRPRLAAAAEGVDLPPPVQEAAGVLSVIARVVGLALFALVFASAVWGIDSPAANIAPVALYVVFWVGLQLVSSLVGDVWRSMNPFDTLAAIFRVGQGEEDAGPGHWLAALMLLSFAWLELAYYDPSSPRVVAVWLGVYTVVVVAGAGLWGRQWLRYGEGFAGLFGLLANMAPLYRDEHSRLRARWPLSGLSRMKIRRGTAALVLVTLGSTTFDGFSRTTAWGDVVGSRTEWSATLVNTFGLLWMVAVVAAAYYGATWLTARIGERDSAEMFRTFLPSLVPIVLAYSLAHYFSLLVFESQNFVVLASDPLGRGWDLFGTISNRVNYTVVSTTTIAWVQAAAIIFGHVCGVTVAHDRAVELFPPERAVQTQYPMLAVMIAYTIGGLALLLGA